jgi:hypothetical protein
VGGRCPPKQTIAGAPTYFVGNMYEKSGTQETKYYCAGATRVAMRVGTTDPYYLVSDQPPPPLRGTSPQCAGARASKIRAKTAHSGEESGVDLG